VASQEGSLDIVCMDRLENFTSNYSSVAAWLFISAETCLPWGYLAMNVFIVSAIPNFVIMSQYHFFDS
jgi:hypothetical protein